jgi:hypothetical protein
MKTIHLLIYLIALLPLSGQEGDTLPENSKQASKILSQVRYAYPQKTLGMIKSMFLEHMIHLLKKSKTMI